MSAYKIQVIDKSDFNQLPSLMMDCFNLTVEESYFEWKYLQNPAGEAICIAAKDENNIIVAFEALMPEVYMFWGVPRIIFHSVDTMTHSKHRKKGLYKLIAFKGFELLKQRNNLFEFGFGGDMSTPPILKFGWKIIFNINYYFRTSIQCFISNNSNWFNSPNKNSFLIREFSDLNLIESLHQLSQTSPISKLIDAKVMAYKLAHPLYNFTCVGLFSNNSLEAYFVYYVHNNKLFLYDLFLNEEENSRIAQTLFREIDSLVINKKLKGVVTFGQEKSPYVKLLKRHGFIRNPFKFGPLNRKIPFLIYVEKDKFPEYSTPCHWTITPIYHDSL